MSRGIEVLGGGLGLSNKSNPLISIYNIIDLDMALIKYIITSFRNQQVFDLDKIKDMTYFDILGELYRRKYKNPLYFLKKSDEYDGFLDQCYQEFQVDHESEILNRAVYTEFYNVLLDFEASGDIIPNILYYTEKQLEFLNSIEEFSSINKVSINDIINSETSRDKFTQFYFKYLDEIRPFMLEGKTYYFSTCGLNLNDENNDLRDQDLIKDIIDINSKINLFDLYQMDIIGRYNDYESDEE